MMLEIKETERKNQPGCLLSQLRQIFKNLDNGMERSGIDADLKQEANTKGSIDPINLVNERAPLTIPRIKRVMDQRRIWERRWSSMKLWNKFRVVMNQPDGYGVDSLNCGWQHYWYLINSS